jgi:hypothetical protein
MKAWAFVAAVATLAAHGQAPEELRAMLEKGLAAQAYEAARRSPERMGDPAFDLYFGIAAINAGHAAEGVLALERFMLADPGNLAARVELARGYFLLAEDQRAREEFEAALGQSPPPAMARVIGDYLDALRSRQSRYRPTFTAHVELGGGYDSNPRAGVDNPLLTLPTIGEVTIADTGVRQSSRAELAGAGFRVTAPAGPRTAAFAAAQADITRYAKASDFDQNAYGGSAGFLGQWRAHSWRAGAVEGYQTLGSLPYRRTHGAFADWAMALGERAAVSAGAQAGRFEYSGANAARDADFATLALSLRRAIAAPLDPHFEVAVNGGYERNVHDERQDLSRDLYGGRLGAGFSAFGAWTLGVGATYQRSRYREPDAVLLVARDDRYAAAEVALAWKPWRHFSLRLEYTEARNRSNIALYEYRRRTALIRGRYEFR